MAKSMTTADWLDDLRRIGEQGGAEGMTTGEMAEKLNLTQGTVRKRLGEAIAAGVFELSGSRSVMSIAGIPQPRPVYRPVPQKK